METLRLKLSLTDEEIRKLSEMLGREPNTLELLMVDAEWSEHCSYKSSKPLLKGFLTEGERVILGPGYDAGVLDLGNSYILTIHIESHNHPSAIDPYGGAATGIGGVVRDILSMGTRPIALLDVLRFGRIDKSNHSKWLFKNVIKGIADYGNCIGVPTIAGEIEFDECFERNCLVDVVCLGLGKRENLTLSLAQDEGDSIILVGGRTGRDGIKGASFASKTLADEEDRSVVQIPDPFTKKLLIEATLEAVATGRVKGLKDLGGGGLSCALSEVADKGNSGLIINLDKIPLREEDMNEIEIMLSESQERMLFVVEKGYEYEIGKIFEKYGLNFSVIGKVCKDGYLNLKNKERLVSRIPVKILANAPIIYRESKEPPLKEFENIEKPSLDLDWNKVLKRLLSNPSIASKAWVYEQYDHEVGVRTVIKPGFSDASVLRIPHGKFIAVKADGNSKHCNLDPYNGSAGILSEACRNVICVGAEPMAFVDHMQFGDPGNPEVFWYFSQAVKGMADYSKHLNIPCVGGKVSFYNEDEVTKKAIKPSPIACVIGLIEREEQIKRIEANYNDSIFLLGITKDEMGGSEYYEFIHNLVGGLCPKVNFEFDKTLFKALKEAIKKDLVKSLHDLSKGGLAIALAELCIFNNRGIKVNLDSLPRKTNRVDEILFSESHSRFLIIPRKGRIKELKNLFEEKGIPFVRIGKVYGEELDIFFQGRNLIKLGLDDLLKPYHESIPKIMGDLE
ncbi:MAG: phosphoribosylformylglycinamidine synthase subunit PurL [Nitrososphaerales archaeon]